MTFSPDSRAALAILAGVSIATIAMPSTTHAGGVVIESHVGQRATDADALLGPIKAELASAGYATGVKFAKQIETSISGSSNQLTKKQIDTAEKFIKSGRKEYVNGRFGTAVKDFAYGINLLFSASTTMARDQSLRATLSMGLIGLGLAHKRLGHTAKATKPVAELIRSMPDKELSRAKHGPDAHVLYRKVKNDLTAQGLGGLRINAGDAMVFVNERFIGVGRVSLKDLLPGRYRIYTQRGDVHGRLRAVSVEPGNEKVVSIPWALDGALRTEGGNVSLAFGTEIERAKQAGNLAMRVARGVGASSLVVIGVRDVDGRRTIVGTAYSIDSGKPLREGRLVVEPVAPSGKKLRALGKFLGGDESLASMFTSAKPVGMRPVSDGRTDAATPWHSDKLGWAIAGTGAVLAGVGVGFFTSAAGLDGDADNEPSQIEADKLRDQAGSRRTWGTVIAVTGGVALVSGIVRLVLHPRASKSSKRNVSLVVAPRWVALSGRF